MLKKEDMFTAMLPENTIKTIIIDECQRIKNHLSDRAKAVQRIAKSTPHIIPMSGSPIYNNAGEYFTVLNLVDPLRFNQHQRYLNTYCDTYESFYATKVGGLKDANKFHEDTKDLIIRRTKAEVLKDLPELNRKFFHVEFKKELRSAYEAQLAELEDLFYGDGDSFSNAGATIAIISKLRHLTGLSKVDECVDFVTEFLLSCDRKIVIFHHHLDVADQIEMRLNEYLRAGGLPTVLKMHSGLDGNGRAQLAKTFQDSDNRVMIASTQAAGEGLNLQFCSDAVMLERQWNPPREEQAEARFHRFGQKNSVSVTYMIASGTIDEYFTELVEKKRAIILQTMDNKEIMWEENSLMKELVEILVTCGKKKWTI
jgi:SNF2 family DNA or RNA helicase